MTIPSLRTLLAAAAALAGAGAVAWLLVGSPYVRYATLRIVGNERAPATQLRHLVDLPQGDPLVMLDLDLAAQGAMRHPWVRSAEARRSFPDTVVLQITEREVVAVAVLDELYLVDRDGRIFTKAEAGDLDHPYLTGLDSERMSREPEVARRLVSEAIAWIDAVRTRGGIPESDISEVRFDARSGYALVLRNGGEVLLGFADRERASRLALLAQQGVDFQTPARIDLASERLAVVTPL
jgi:cell division protein FtsQ